MATISVAREAITQRNTIVYRWETLTETNLDGEAVELASYADKTVQIGATGGNTDGGATIVLQGSNDTDPSAAVWFTLTDPQGNAISTTTAALMEQITENPRWIRPLITGGTGVDMDVILVCKK